MKYSNIPSAQTLVLAFESMGIENIVISPGSRNAPLTLGFTKNPYFTCYSVVDERSAAFFALGLAQQSGRPVALVCTSGSALLNYYPAVAEAFYSDIPLLVVSADRPTYRIDIGDGQTIRQQNLLEKHVAYSAQLEQDPSHSTELFAKYGRRLESSQEKVQAHNEAELEKAVRTALGENAPVHINIPFEEPLYNQVEQASVRPVPKVGTEPRRVSLDLEPHRSLWKNSPRKMVLVGVNPPDSLDKEVLEALAKDGNTLVFTETTSNVHHKGFFPSIDSILAPIEKSDRRQALFEALRPDLLVTFGGMIISKKIKAFLRQYRPATHWHIDPKKAYDTFFCLTEHIRAIPNEVLASIVSPNSTVSPYKQQWLEAKKSYELGRENYLKKIPFSDFSVFDQLLKSIPKGYRLHLANSSTVRYAQLFDLDPDLKVFCNRGTSGIDGSTSTAIGGSLHGPSPSVLLSGDLGFFYDSNALWNQYIRPDFRIVVINNGGGGIFRILPGQEETAEFETFFETHHSHTAKHLAAMHGFDYTPVHDMDRLKIALGDFYGASNRPGILEVFTPRKLNNKILLDYFESIS